MAADDLSNLHWKSGHVWVITSHYFVMGVVTYARPKLNAGQKSWWRHQMEICSALLALCAGNSPVTGEFPTQRPVTRSFDVFFDLRLNKRSSKQSWGWWSETPLCSLRRQCNGYKWPMTRIMKSQFKFSSAWTTCNDRGYHTVWWHFITKL